MVKAMLTLCCLVFITTELLYAGENKALTIRSTAFANGSGMPSTYTCEGKDIAPPLEWEGVPENTRSLVLIVDDPDAPDPRAPRMTWVHWVLYNIPPDATNLPEGTTSRDLPSGAGEGQNDWKRTAYGGPCPPIGRHRYYYKLYALDIVLKGLSSKPNKAEIQAAMSGHVIANTELVGTYEKTR